MYTKDLLTGTARTTNPFALLDEHGQYTMSMSHRWGRSAGWDQALAPLALAPSHNQARMEELDCAVCLVV